LGLHLSALVVFRAFLTLTLLSLIPSPSNGPEEDAVLRFLLARMGPYPLLFGVVLMKGYNLPPLLIDPAETAPVILPVLYLCPRRALCLELISRLRDSTTM